MVELSKNKDFLNSLKSQEETELFDFYKTLNKINPTANKGFAKKGRK